MTSGDARPVAWMVVDSRGRRSVYIDRARAEQRAVELHGILVPLGAMTPIPEPEPERQPGA